MLHGKTTPGASTSWGEKYEYGVCGLAYLRLLDRRKPFQLNSNLSDLGALDDVAIYDETSKTLFCAQLKHKQNARQIKTTALLKEQGDFSILKYYESYQDIKKKSADKLGIFKRLSFDNIYSVLYTNSPIQHSSTDDITTELREVLSTGKEKESIFRFGSGDTEIWNLKKGFEDEKDYRTFLSTFLIYSKQGNAELVLDLVQEKVAKLALVADEELKLLNTNFLKEMEAWRNKADSLTDKMGDCRNRADPLSESSSLWFTLLRNHLNHKVKKISYEFKFNDKTKTLISGDYLNISVPDIDRDIRYLKVLALVRSECGDNYLFFDAPQSSQSEAVHSVCLSNHCDNIIINVDNEEDIPEFLSGLQTRKKRLILVSGRELKLAQEWTHKTDTWCLGDLTPDSQELMGQTMVQFQRVDVRLSKLIEPKENENIVQGKTVSALLKGLSISIGGHLPIVDKLYIEHSLCHQTVLEYNVLKEEHKHDVFIVSHLPKDQEVHMSSSTIISTAGEEQEQLRFVDKNIHWLEYSDGFLFWKDTKGDDSLVRNHVSTMSSTCHKKLGTCLHKSLLSQVWNGKVRLLTGQPGIGKTSLLRHLTVEHKKQNPEQWMIFVPLRDYQTTLSNYRPEDITLEKVVDLLCQAANIKDSKTARNLLMDSVKNKGNICIFLDAVDEVSPIYKVQVLSILKLLLRQSNVKEIWITSRPMVESYLQENLQTLPLVIQPFTEGQQTEYLTSYFQQNGLKNKEISTITKQIMIDLRTSLTHICEVPFHARLVAEIFIEHSKQHRESTMELGAATKHLYHLFTGRESQYTIHLHQLYKIFFSKKYEDAFEEKGETCTKNQFILEIMQERQKMIMDNHTRCALLETFTVEQLVFLDINVGLLSKEEFIQLQRFGIIERVIEGIPIFVHKSLSEYLVACWLKHVYQEETRKSTLWSRIKKKARTLCTDGRSVNKYAIISKWGFDNVIYFFDQMMADEFQLHQMVLRGDIVRVQELLEDRSVVNNVDNGGRLALHLAASHGKTDIAELLVDSKSRVDVCDKVMGWRPLRYADNKESWETVALLTQNGAKDSDVPRLKSEVHNKGIMQKILSTGHDHDLILDTAVHAIFSSLLDAASNGKKYLVCWWLIRGADVGVKDGRGRTPLYCAAGNGHVEVVKLLLEHRADVNVKDCYKHTPLHESAGEGHVEVVKLLVEHRADVNAQDHCESTPLHKPAHKGHVEVVKLLVKHGADVNVKNRFESTPLREAAHEGHVEVVKLLLEHRADVNVKDCYEHTPLHEPTGEGHVEGVKLLLEQGTDVNVKDQHKSTPLIDAAGCGHVEVVKLLVEHGADVNVKDRSESTPLHRAAGEGRIEVVKLLSKHEAVVNVNDWWGRTPLYWAAGNGYVEVVKLLLEQGTDVNIKDRYESTPLHEAADSGHVELVKLLLEHGADVMVQNQYKYTPLHKAAESGHAEVVKLLLERGADVNIQNQFNCTPLHRAAGWGRLEVIKLMLELGADVNVQDQYKRTPLHYAAREGLVEMVKLLLEHGAEVNVQDQYKRSPLLEAAGRGHVEMVKLLLEHGADVNVQDQDKYSPLHKAAGRGHIEVVKLLLEHGADVNVQDQDKYSPLHKAAGRGHIEVVKLLIEHGADVNVNDKYEETLLQEAACRGHKEVVNLLLIHGT